MLVLKATLQIMACEQQEPPTASVPEAPIQKGLVASQHNRCSAQLQKHHSTPRAVTNLLPDNTIGPLNCDIAKVRAEANCM